MSVLVWSLIGAVSLGGGFLGFRFQSLGKESQSMSPRVGLMDGKLLPCSSKPNCASSEHPKEAFRVKPFVFSGEKKQLIEKLKKSSQALGAQLQRETDEYLYFTFTSKMWGFVDDVEFLVVSEQGNQIVHSRSASRVGHSDLGVNKKRLLKIFKEIEN